MKSMVNMTMVPVGRRGRTARLVSGTCCTVEDDKAHNHSCQRWQGLPRGLRSQQTGDCAWWRGRLSVAASEQKGEHDVTWLRSQGNCLSPGGRKRITHGNSTSARRHKAWFCWQLRTEKQQRLRGRSLHATEAHAKRTHAGHSARNEVVNDAGEDNVVQREGALERHHGQVDGVGPARGDGCVARLPVGVGAIVGDLSGTVRIKWGGERTVVVAKVYGLVSGD